MQLGEAAARSAILQGAASVFAKHGARAASVEDILAAAKLSRRTFYRFYESKEDVLVALYRVGDRGLARGLSDAVREEQTPLRQVERCIDAHLANALGLGRLVFVLGGEAQRHESALHARRLEVHDALAQLLAEGHADRQIDPWLFRGLILALEGVTRIMLTEGDEGRAVTAASVARAKAVMMRVATSTLAGDGPGVTSLPSLSLSRADPPASTKTPELITSRATNSRAH